MSTKAVAVALNVQRMRKETPFLLTIHTTLQDFQTKFLDKYGQTLSDESVVQQQTKTQEEEEVERELYEMLQYCITLDGDFQLRFTKGEKNVINQSEEVFSRYFSDLMEFIRKKYWKSGRLRETRYVREVSFS